MYFDSHTVCIERQHHQQQQSQPTSNNNNNNKGLDDEELTVSIQNMNRHKMYRGQSKMLGSNFRHQNSNNGAAANNANNGGNRFTSQKLQQRLLQQQQQSQSNSSFHIGNAQLKNNETISFPLMNNRNSQQQQQRLDSSVIGMPMKNKYNGGNSSSSSGSNKLLPEQNNYQQHPTNLLPNNPRFELLPTSSVVPTGDGGNFDLTEDILLEEDDDDGVISDEIKSHDSTMSDSPSTNQQPRTQQIVNNDLLAFVDNVTPPTSSTPVKMFKPAVQAIPVQHQFNVSNIDNLNSSYSRNVLSELSDLNSCLTNIKSNADLFVLEAPPAGNESESTIQLELRAAATAAENILQSQPKSKTISNNLRKRKKVSFQMAREPDDEPDSIMENVFSFNFRNKENVNPNLNVHDANLNNNSGNNNKNPTSRQPLQDVTSNFVFSASSPTSYSSSAGAAANENNAITIEYSPPMKKWPRSEFFAQKRREYDDCYNSFEIYHDSDNDDDEHSF